MRKKNDKKPLTNYQKSKYEESKYCHIYDQPFNTNKDIKCYTNFKKVKDHDYYTG